MGDVGGLWVIGDGVMGEWVALGHGMGMGWSLGTWDEGVLDGEI